MHRCVTYVCVYAPRGAAFAAAAEQVRGVGPIDPAIGVLRLDRLSDGATLCVLYNFAVHPIMGTADASNGADLTGFASSLIEDGFDPQLTTAIFLQGCCGDVNPIGYKDVDRPRDAKALGLQLGHAVLRVGEQVPLSSISGQLLSPPHPPTTMISPADRLGLRV